MPMTHLQGSSSGREASELQRVAMEMMPEVAAVRPESVQRVTVGERERGDAGVDEAAATGGGAAAAVREACRRKCFPSRRTRFFPADYFRFPDGWRGTCPAP